MLRLTSGSKGLNNSKFSEFFTSGDSGTPDAGGVVSVGFGNTIDETEDAQTLEITRQLSAGNRRQIFLQIGAAQAMNIKFSALNGEQQGLFCGIEDVEAVKRNAPLNLGASSRVSEPCRSQV